MDAALASESIYSWLCFSTCLSSTLQTCGRHWTSLLAYVRHPRNDAPTFFQRRPLITLLCHHRLHDELHAHTWTECPCCWSKKIQLLLRSYIKCEPRFSSHECFRCLHQQTLLSHTFLLESPDHFKIIPCTHRLITFVPLVGHCCALLSSSCTKHFVHKSTA